VTDGGNQHPHAPPPSLWPVGFAVGVAVLLIGLIVGAHIIVLGAVLAVAFGFLWVRDLVGGESAEVQRTESVEGVSARPVTPGAPGGGEHALPLATEEEVDRFPRSKFLEGATLGIGAAIGGLVTVPALGFAVLPSFTAPEADEVDVGPLDAYPEGEWRVATFLGNPDQGEVTRQTVFVRNNGAIDGQPSLTVLSNRCVHLGCPVQPTGPIEEDEREDIETERAVVSVTPTSPSGFACPCHGGAYNLEGNRTAGPPVRALDRYAFSIRNGHVWLGRAYAIGEVRGEGAEAVMVRYHRMPPGVHVDGIERFLYPVAPPR
jgi:menaquinol-cytochrome c reductase iron-sulfur subunit